MSTPRSPATSRACASAASKPSGDEVERRPALHLDRLVGVVSQHEHGGVIWRLVAPPAAPVLIPRAADRAEHVSAHHVRPARSASASSWRRCPPRGSPRRDAMLELHAADAERVLAALPRSGDEAVERHGHVAGDFGHGGHDSDYPSESSLSARARAERPACRALMNLFGSAERGLQGPRQYLVCDEQPCGADLQADLRRLGGVPPRRP